MRKYNKLLVFVLLLISGVLLTSCEMVAIPQGPTRTISEISVDTTTIPTQAIVGTFDIEEADLGISYDDGITEYISIDSSMLSAEDLAKLNTVGLHSIVVIYQGYSTVFTINIVEENTENIEEVVDEVINSISVPSTTTKDFVLTTSKNGVNISWSSSGANIVVNGALAKVTRPLSTEENVSVALTANFTYEGLTKTKVYTVEVIKEEPKDTSSSYTGTYYNSVNLDLVGTALKQELRNLMLSTHKYYTTYGDCKTYLPSIDEDLSNSKNMILFYTGESIVKSQDLNNDWNREHVWAKSLGWFDTSGAGSDLHHIRPCDISVNSSRGNKKFGVGGSYYTPTDEYKGDVARIIFYLMVAYSESDKYSFTSIAQSQQLLLEWNRLDPVSELEIVRNDKVEKIQGNRNPFIDYAYLADSIWG